MNKYLRRIQAVDGPAFVTADVYSILVGFNVTCPARQHSIKKLLCAGLRGKGDALQDLVEARQAIDRAIQLMGEPVDAGIVCECERASDSKCRMLRCVECCGKWCDEKCPVYTGKP